MSKDEPELIAQILDGDQELYGALIDRYKNNLYRHCFYIVRDEDIAEDMAQEAFIKAYQSLKSYDATQSSFKTWLFVIGTRKCLSYLRKQRALHLEDEDHVAGAQSTPDQLVKDQELYDAVMRLKPQYRTVVSLYYWHGYRYDEIAAAMNVPLGSIRGWLHRAKQELKEALS